MAKGIGPPLPRGLGSPDEKNGSRQDVNLKKEKEKNMKYKQENVK
jgi:hypothetical protein